MAKRKYNTPDGGKSYRTIGKELGISCERVRQIRNRAMKKIREYIEQDPQLKSELAYPLKDNGR